MTFGLSAGAIALIGAGATVAGGAIAANGAKKAANTAAAGNAEAAELQYQGNREAAQLQAQGNREAIDESRRQYDTLNNLLRPYYDAGLRGLAGYEGLIGLAGPEAQQAAIAGIQGSPQFGALTKQGEDAILAHASATGGLRGGNTQMALADWRQGVLAQLIEQQTGRMNGLATMGQNSGARVGFAGMNSGIPQLMAGGANAQATGLLGGANARAAGVLGSANANASGQMLGTNALVNSLGGVTGLLAGRDWGGGAAPPVSDGGYSMGLGNAYGGTITEGQFTPNRAGF